MKHLLISCWFCVLATILASSYGQVQPYAERYCGAKFANTLFALCTQKIIKKIPMDYRDNYPDYSLNENNELPAYFSYPKRTMEYRMPIELRKRAKATRECCVNACTMKQLQEYCVSYLVYK
ncbi:bombyxin-related peptide A-like [Agrilus planipennis]|uniref:Bombyxin-related peptide A-like n=1 Tax=Agrilus planipennis TaxID=224129 RepID=A0A1W4WEK4_AGRPL|nr:bombyxin-related peptide A-like [Agrilus planipennis]